MNRNYIIRLDDASDHMNLNNWKRMEALLDKYGIKPIVGIIPFNRDDSIINQYEYNPGFWELATSWQDKGWHIAMHGYEHRYITNEGGINPVNKRSEFAGLPYNIQAEKINKGYTLLLEKRIKPTLFFAPAHTFDENTIRALIDNTDIRMICDTIARDIYRKNEIIFIPQQSGKVRSLPFIKTATFCYHPNTMTNISFDELETFIRKKQLYFNYPSFTNIHAKDWIDNLLEKIYMRKHR